MVSILSTLYFISDIVQIGLFDTVFEMAEKGHVLDLIPILGQLIWSELSKIKTTYFKSCLDNKTKTHANQIDLKDKNVIKTMDTFPANRSVEELNLRQNKNYSNELYQAKEAKLY